MGQFYSFDALSKLCGDRVEGHLPWERYPRHPPAHYDAEVASDAWFRNRTWDEEVAARFEAKLRRARPVNRAQYLRIQGTTLAETRPEAALKLLDRYLAEYDDGLDRTAAHYSRATAFVELGRLDDGVAAYEAVLAREREFPQVRTNAFAELPFLVATRELKRHYPRAWELLNERGHEALFPFQAFQVSTAMAIIAADSGDKEQARVYADVAILAGRMTHSGARWHPRLGLVPQHWVDRVREMFEERALLPKT